MSRDVWTRLGGRKFALSALGVVCVTLMAVLGATTGEAFIAVGTIVLSFCGGNAAIEWRHAGSSHTARQVSEHTTRQVSEGFEPTP